MTAIEPTLVPNLSEQYAALRQLCANDTVVYVQDANNPSFTLCLASTPPDFVAWLRQSYNHDDFRTLVAVDDPPTNPRQKKRRRTGAKTQKGPRVKVRGPRSGGEEEGDIDEELLAWIGAEFKDRTGESPAVEDIDLLVWRARAVSGTPAKEIVRTFCSDWRRHVTLRPTDSIEALPHLRAALPSSQGGGLISSQPHEDKEAAFCRLYRRVAGWGALGVVAGYSYRAELAEMWDCYMLVQRQIEREDGRMVFFSQNGELSRATAKKAKQRLVHRLAGPDPPLHAYNKLDAELSKAKRWQYIRDKLGIPTLAVWPEAIVPHSWVEGKALPWTKLEVWVDMIIKFYPPSAWVHGTVMRVLRSAVEGRVPPDDLDLGGEPISRGSTVPAESEEDMGTSKACLGDNSTDNPDDEIDLGSVQNL